MSSSKLPIEQVISKLGYKETENYYEYNQLNDSPISFQSKKALLCIKPYATYLINNKPFILFFDVQFNEDTFKQICAKVWNAQIPVAIFCDETTVKVFNGLSLNSSSLLLDSIADYSLRDCNSNSDFSILQLTNVVFWKKYEKQYSGIKLNQILLDNIEYLTTELKHKYKIPFATKLVLRLIFIRYLIDRGVDLDYKGFSNDIKKSKNEFLRIVSKKDELYVLFNHLNSKFHGNLFDLRGEKDCKYLLDEVFELLYAFFSGQEYMKNGQQSLFCLYDFNIIPVELISNIYEIMLGKHARDYDHAFYTPNYLVEFVLDRVISKKLKENKRLNILDPSCGSGVFLVDSYRRIIQENISTSYCEDDDLLNELLKNHIYGIDINEEAIDVTIFSLYLTILDYKDPKTLCHFELPDLKNNNIFVGDFFDDSVLKAITDKKLEFDFILGNPPWGSVKNGMHMQYCYAKGYTDLQQNNEICRSFVFRAKDFCSKNTTCCFILHSKLLYNQKGPSKRFRSFMLKNTKIENLFEMSAVRKLVFENANAPAIIMSFSYNEDGCKNSNLNNRFTYVAIKNNIFFKLFNVICIEKNDIKSVTQSMLYNYDWAWKTIVYGTTFDIDLIIRLKEKYPTLKEVLDYHKEELLFGAGVEYQDGDLKDASHLVGRKLLKSNNSVDHFFVDVNNTNVFNKQKIHRTIDERLFDPPFVLIPTGIDCENYRLKAAFCADSLVSKKTMYIIKGTEAKKTFLQNLVGLLNSSLYAYLNLMLGSSVGIEREQRFMDEVLSYPYVFSDEIVKNVVNIQLLKEKNYNECSMKKEQKIKEAVEYLDNLVLNKFEIQDQKPIDYSIEYLIPQLTNSDLAGRAYDKVSLIELKEYCRCFIDYFNAFLNNTQKYYSISLYPQVINYYSVFELEIVDKEPKEKIIIKNEIPDSVIQLAKLSLFSFNEKVYQLRDILSFSNNAFSIIKPYFRKYWHPLMAKSDLLDVIDDIMTGTRGDQ